MYQVHKVLNPDETHQVKVGDKVEYRAGPERQAVYDDAEVIGIEAFVIAVNDFIEVDEVYEYTSDQDISLVIFHVKTQHGNQHWGYWDQVRVP